jgi:stage II sporulation protein D
VARAALAQGLATHDTRIACPRRVEVRGRRVDCVHPDLGRPLGLEDALAHSCNHFFVRLADRLDRATLASVLRHLSDGAIALADDVPLPLVALGLDGPRAGMRTWARVAVAAWTWDAGDPDHALRVRRGAIRAAQEGTAVALADPAMLTLAKTGTTVSDGSAQEGRVVAWRPEIGEVIVVRAPGVSGRDAARLARAAWDTAAGHDEPRVRVGRVREPAGDAVESVPLEAYVAGVVGAEGDGDMPAVALEALAVAARSYALAPGPRHTRDGYDVCDTTHCQVVGASTSWSRDAAARTRGIVLTRRAATVGLPYSASCGGVLTPPRDIWGGGPPGVTRTGPDPADHPVHEWRGEAGADELLAALREAGHRGDQLLDVRVVARTRDGVASRVALDGMTPAQIDATAFRHVVGRRIGWHVLKSYTWEVTRSGRGYRFTGRGLGHGAGLCLRGASALAARGASVTEVLATYAPGATLRAGQDRVTLQVPSALTSGAPRVRGEILAGLADLRLRLAVTAPRVIAVEVHPTREAYQRATGRAWWTSANTRPLGGGRYRVDLAPPAAASARPALMAVLRHESVHVLTASVLAGVPAWAAEGLAHTMTQAGRVAGSPIPAPCPTDMEVVRPGSLDAMRDVYARAAACVSAALPDGVAGWRTLALHP